jgi:hypothetical protein
MTDTAISPLRQRMIEDMTIRKLTPKTQHDYVQRLKHFAAFLGRSPDSASFEDVRRYQLHLAASGAGVPTLNQSVSTLRFFFRVTLGRSDGRDQLAMLPRRADVGAAMIAHGAKHPRLKIPESHGVRKAARVDLDIASTGRIAATDEHVVSAEAPHVRKRHRLVVKQEVWDRPWHAALKRGLGGSVLVSGPVVSRVLRQEGCSTGEPT